MIDAFVHLNNEILGEDHLIEKSKLIAPLTSNEYVKKGIEAANKNASDIGALDEVIHRLAGHLDEKESYSLLGITGDDGPSITMHTAESEVDREILSTIKQDAVAYLASLSGPTRGDNFTKISSLFKDEYLED
jgi:hypothetical protein